MVTLDAPFFSSVRSKLFGGHLTGPQVDGINAIATGWNAGYASDDVRKFGYCLATAFHETARTMQPIEEYGKGRGKKYGVPDATTHQVYYGRGLVQLTWIFNYRRMGTLLNIDLVNHPELALQPDTAGPIMFKGMTMGLFTGKKLSDYFNDKDEDPVQARRIINGLDQAVLIAGYYDNFMDALEA